LNLAFSNKGAVVRPGEMVLEIVPDNQDLIATAEIDPSDRDSVYEGLSVEARLSVEAFIFSGEKRTFLEYLVEPVSATMRKAARE